MKRNIIDILLILIICILLFVTFIQTPTNIKPVLNRNNTSCYFISSPSNILIYHDTTGQIWGVAILGDKQLCK